MKDEYLLERMQLHVGVEERPEIPYLDYDIDSS